MRQRKCRRYYQNDWNEFNVGEETDDDPIVDSSDGSESSYDPNDRKF
jgi:hypothetical protein